MSLILDGADQLLIEQFKQPGTLYAFDYDGTLAPISAEPQQAVISPGTRRLLADLARARPVVVITGRARADALRLLAGVPLLEVIGNHGAETEATDDPGWRARVREWCERLSPQLSKHPGIFLEDKIYSLALHYRSSPDWCAALRWLEEATAGLPGVRRVRGKAVLNLLPAEAPHKGEALLAAMTRHICQRALFAGDDETDEDVFRMDPSLPVLGIRVGMSPGSSARFYVRSQADLNRLIESLLRG